MVTTLESKRAIPHLDPQMFVGKSYGDAKATIEGAGYTCKTALNDRRISFRYMTSYDPLIINLVVINNIVTAAWKG